MSTEKQPKTPTAKGPDEWFTGDVYFNAYYRGEEPSRARLNLVRFTPGAHTAWHKHAVGQTLHVTEGLGYVQSRGEELIELHPGDSVYTPATDQVSVPRPSTRRVGGEPLRDQALLEWCGQLLKDVLGDVPAKVPA